jgi:hypothetical protein
MATGSEEGELVAAAAALSAKVRAVLKRKTTTASYASGTLLTPKMACDEKDFLDDQSIERMSRSADLSPYVRINGDDMERVIGATSKRPNLIAVTTQCLNVILAGGVLIGDESVSEADASFKSNYMKGWATDMWRSCWEFGFAAYKLVPDERFGWLPCVLHFGRVQPYMHVNTLGQRCFAYEELPLRHGTFHTNTRGVNGPGSSLVRDKIAEIVGTGGSRRGARVIPAVMTCVLPGFGPELDGSIRSPVRAALDMEQTVERRRELLLLTETIRASPPYFTEEQKQATGKHDAQKVSDGFEAEAAKVMAARQARQGGYADAAATEIERLTTVAGVGARIEMPPERKVVPIQLPQNPENVDRLEILGRQSIEYIFGLSSLGGSGSKMPSLQKRSHNSSVSAGSGGGGGGGAGRTDETWTATKKMMVSLTEQWVRDMEQWAHGAELADAFVRKADNPTDRHTITRQALCSASESTPVKLPGLVQGEMIPGLWSEGLFTYAAYKKYMVKLHGFNAQDFEAVAPSREIDLKTATVEAAVAASDAAIIKTKSAAEGGGGGTQGKNHRKNQKRKTKKQKTS